MTADGSRHWLASGLRCAKQKFDQINIIATHGGGTIPYLAHRIAIGGQQLWANRDGTNPSMPEIYCDLTASTQPAALDAIRRLIPVDRLLIGFDFPMMPVSTIALAIASLRAYSAIKESDAQKITGGNALRLFLSCANGRHDLRRAERPMLLTPRRRHRPYCSPRY